MRLNVCCGGRILPGYTNVDVAPDTGGKAPDIVADAKSIPLPDHCADEIMCIHGWEHFYRFELDELITEWKRLLRPNGLLILELPDLIKCCRNVLENYTLAGKHPDQAGLFGLYGDPRGGNPWMNHRWGWSPESLSDYLRENGFTEIRTDEPTQFHPVGRQRRDMRVTARNAA